MLVVKLKSVFLIMIKLRRKNVGKNEIYCELICV